MQNFKFTDKDLQAIKDYFQELQSTKTDDNYVQWLLAAACKESIYDDDVEYRNDLTQEEIKKYLLISEYESDITWRNPDYKEEYTYNDKESYFPKIVYLLYANGQWYELYTMWGQGSVTVFTQIEDINTWKYKNKIKYYYDMINKNWQKFG